MKARSKHNIVQSKIFSEKLQQTLNGYHNRAISTLAVIEELIKLAKDIDAATKRGEALGLTNDEAAFYDALAANESAVLAMGDDKLKVIAAELIKQVKKASPSTGTCAKARGLESKYLLSVSFVHMAIRWIWQTKQ